MSVPCCPASVGTIGALHLDPAVAITVLAGVALVAAGVLLRHRTGAHGRHEGATDGEPGPQPARASPPSDEALRERQPEAERERATRPLSSPPTRAGMLDRAATLGPPIPPLAATLDRSRRLRAAEQRVADELAGLPADGWMIERYVLVEAHRVPFVIVGARGLVVLAATDGAWTLWDLDLLSRLGDQLRGRVPDCPWPVRAAVCLAFDEHSPRSWHGGAEVQGRGGCVLGIDWLKAWLDDPESQNGASPDELRRLDLAGGPWWNRRATARLPAGRNVG